MGNQFSDREQRQGFTLRDVLDIYLTDNGMGAELHLTSLEKGIAIKEDELLALLHEHGVTHGLIDEQIKSFLENPHAYLGKKILVAKGKEPIPGKDSYVELVYKHKQEKKPKLKEDGTVDYYSIMEIPNVQKGQLIARKIMATKGETGYTVTGQPLEAKDGRDLPIKVGKNVVVDPASQAVYALIDGQVSMLGDQINVFPVFEVNGDLDLSIGNIDFIGNVVIRGNIPAGFSVKAKGDIRITGGVEGVELEADGSIMISSGITAGNKGLIRAKGDIKTSFIINGKVEAEGSVIVNQSIMHSEVLAGDSIICQGSRGLIVGGRLQAGKRVICRTLGNDLNTPTSIEIGINPKIANRIKEIEENLIELKTTLTKNEQALVILENMQKQYGSLPAERRDMHTKLLNNKLVMEQKIKELTEEHRHLMVLQDEIKQAYVEVSSIIYPGSKLTFHKYTKYFKERQRSVKYMLENGEIVGLPLV